MLLGTRSLIGPAVDHWHFGIFVTLSVSLAMSLLLVLVDLFTQRRVLRVTVIGYGLIALSIFTTVPTSNLPFLPSHVNWTNG